MSENTSNQIGNLFIRATRDKLRIATKRGTLLVEDLWDLNLESLNEIAILLDEKIQKHSRKSFIEETDNSGLDDATFAFTIVKYVIDTKLTEKKLAAAEKNRKAQINFLKGLQEKKKLQELENMSSDEINAKLAELGVAE
jgi:hypothetical protein